ncbi:MAG: alpha/beta hydrolase [Betaproteobacteria bacterium]|nr:alpha/beta hydrolase [Betaproteobacteria bacterium]
MPVNARGIAFDLVDLTAPWREPAAPVILLHGIGANRLCWTEWVGVLCPHHPVIRCDLRGFGESAALPEAGDLLFELVADVVSLMPAGGQVHLVGESAGGTIMLATALRHPERVRSLTLSNAAITGRRIGQLDRWRPLFAQGVAAWNAHMMECRFAPGAISEQAWAWYAAQQGRTRPASALAIADLLATLELGEQLPTLQPDLLVLHPDASPFVPLSVYDGLSAACPRAELEVYRGVRHGLPFSHGYDCARRLLAFLARH